MEVPCRPLYACQPRSKRARRETTKFCGERLNPLCSTVVFSCVVPVCLLGSGVLPEPPFCFELKQGCGIPSPFPFPFRRRTGARRRPPLHLGGSMASAIPHW